MRAAGNGHTVLWVEPRGHLSTGLLAGDVEADVRVIERQAGVEPYCAALVVPVTARPL